MIKFPTTVSEYTDGKLWREGTDESIARRILVDLHKVEDRQELGLRRMYLAQFYCDIGEYPLATALARQFLLEDKFVDESVLLLKRICVEARDFESFARLVKLVDSLYKGRPPVKMFEGIDSGDVFSLFNEDHRTEYGEVVYNGGIADYYRDGKLVFSVADKNYEAFIKDSAARYFLSENDADNAIDILSDINLPKLKTSVRLFCEQTLVRAYCMSEKYDEAYEHCQAFIQNDMYMPEMTDIFAYMYRTNSARFQELKTFLENYKDYGNLQLGDMHSLSKDIDDEEFWNRISANNPIDECDVSEGRYLLQGILSFNSGDFESSEKYFRQATALYGRLGKSQYYRYYLRNFIKCPDSGEIGDDMPDKLYTARIDDIYDYNDKRLNATLKRCKSKNDFVKRLDENLLALNNMLLGMYVKSSDIVKITRNIYKTDYLPALDIIDRAAADGEYHILVRAVCLANMMMSGRIKRCIVDKNIYVNPMLKFERNGVKEPLLYGFAIYFAFSMLSGIDGADLKRDCALLKRVYDLSEGDFSKINPLAVFGVASAYFNDEELQYDKDVVKKRDVRNFIETLITDSRFFGDDGYILDDDLFDFLKMCLEII